MECLSRMFAGLKIENAKRIAEQTKEDLQGELDTLEQKLVNGHISRESYILKIANVAEKAELKGFATMYQWVDTIVADYFLNKHKKN